MAQFSLQISGTNLSAEAKMLLAGASACFPTGVASRWGLECYARRTGISERLFRRVLGELVESEVFSICRMEGRAGSRRVRYRWSNVIELNGSTPALSSVIDRVLRAKRTIGPSYLEQVQQKPKLGRAGLKARLSLTNRLLLVVLLCRANKFGVVEGVGSAELRKLTGLSGHRLESQLFKLNAFGLIRSKIPGFSGSDFIGSKKTVYLLNLNHPDIVSTGSGSSVFVFESCTEFGGKSAAQLIFDLADEGDFSSILGLDNSAVFYEGFNDISSLFSGLSEERRKAVCGMLQFVVERCASHFLSHCLDRVVNGEVAYDDEFLAQVASWVKDRSPSRFARKFSGVSVQVLICKFSQVLAGSVYSRLKRILPRYLGAHEFFLVSTVPPEGAPGLSAVLAIEKEDGGGRCFRVADHWGFFDGWTDYICESSIPAEVRHEAGLMSTFSKYKRYADY